jgi:hypothetical protein
MAHLLGGCDGLGFRLVVIWRYGQCRSEGHELVVAGNDQAPVCCGKIRTAVADRAQRYRRAAPRAGNAVDYIDFVTGRPEYFVTSHDTAAHAANSSVLTFRPIESQLTRSHIERRQPIAAHNQVVANYAKKVERVRKLVGRPRRLAGVGVEGE